MPTATDSPPGRRRGIVLLLHFSHPVTDIIHFVDYAVDETAHLRRLRAGRTRHSSGQPSPPASTSQWRPPPVGPARPSCARIRA
jgi:hypothetical protein